MKDYDYAADLVCGPLYDTTPPNPFIPYYCVRGDIIHLDFIKETIQTIEAYHKEWARSMGASDIIYRDLEECSYKLNHNFQGRSTLQPLWKPLSDEQLLHFMRHGWVHVAKFAGKEIGFIIYEITTEGTVYHPNQYKLVTLHFIYVEARMRGLGVAAHLRSRLPQIISPTPALPAGGGRKV